MVVSPSSSSSPAPPETKTENSDAENPSIQSNQPDPSSDLPPPPATTSSSSPSASSVITENPNSNSLLSTPQPPLVQSYTASTISPGALPPSAPSFRPITQMTMSTPHFSSLPNPNMQNPNFQNPSVQPPGVNPVSIMLPGMYQPPPGQPLHPSARPYGGYAMPPAPQGTIPPPGILRYPSPYTPMVRPTFPPRPPGVVGVHPSLMRPPVPGIHGVHPGMPPLVRPLVPIVAPTEKPQTTVYVGKIASTVENDFILSLLRLCGPVKSWKRAQDPSDGTPRGFGFCEFESAEGVLRALRLLSKFNVDGQELVLNVNQATREYLERYVEKKTEREKLKETESADKEEESAPGVEKKDPTKEPKPTVENTKKDDSDSVDKESQDTAQNFGVVTDEDREADQDALEKLRNMLEERLKTKPLPPPPAHRPADISGKSNSEVPSRSRDVDSDVDIVKSDGPDEKNDDETSENKPTSEPDKPEATSPDKNRRHNRRSRDKDRERDLKREKERELERYERERERERTRRERDREMKIREVERLYKERVKEWESREREKEYQRQHEKEREKERERERKREIMDQEDESDDDDTRKRRRRSSAIEEKRKKRQREKEEDLADKLREEEEIAEGKRRAIEEQLQQKNEPKYVPDQLMTESDKTMVPKEIVVKDDAVEQSYENDSVVANHAGDVVMGNGVSAHETETTMSAIAESDTRQSSNAPARKLGFGLVGSGKRTAVPSVFHEEDDDEATKDKKMRPLVPIDYSTEEIQAVQSTVSEAQPNLAAAAEFAKRISGSNSKEERSEVERDRNKRSGDRSSHRDRSDEENNRARDESRERNHDRDRNRDREHGPNKQLKTSENKKLLDAKQLIDMIPKTKEELFSYEINWVVYDKHDLHERMRPWISKKITEFLGEEEATLVDYIVSSTKDHVRASQMLELLQSILDDEAEMFVLKMWRMLIFEIKKVETGLSLKTTRT